MTDLAKTPLFSLIVVYRNRDIPRVKRFLDSLLWQTNQNFELVFVDYGSSVTHQKEVQQLLQPVPFVKYIYTETRGLLWSRSKALNLGISQATGDYITTLDIDLILSPEFINMTLEKIKKQHFIQYQCYYLPRNFNKFDQLFLADFTPEKHFDTTVKATAYGIVTFARDILTETGMYNEYYQLWGLEDIDFINRVKELAACKETYLPNIRIYHQWHPHSKEDFPKGWEGVMINHYNKHKDQTGVVTKDAVTQTIQDRPALQIYLQNNIREFSLFQFLYPKEQAFAAFCYQFDQLESNECLVVNQSFDLIKDSQKTKWGRLFSYINKVFTRLGVSYRWVDLETHSTEVILKQEVRDFLFYFLRVWQRQISDYYFSYHTQGKGLVLVIIKK